MRGVCRPPSGRERTACACQVVAHADDGVTHMVPVRRSVLQLIREVNKERDRAHEALRFAHHQPIKERQAGGGWSGSRSTHGESRCGLSEPDSTPPPALSISTPSSRVSDSKAAAPLLTSRTSATRRVSQASPDAARASRLSAAEGVFSAQSIRPTVLHCNPAPLPRPPTDGRRAPHATCLLRRRCAYMKQSSAANSLTQLARRVLEKDMTATLLPLLALHEDGAADTALHVADVDGGCLQCSPAPRALVDQLGTLGSYAEDVQLHLLLEPRPEERGTVGASTGAAEGTATARLQLESRTSTPATGSDFGSTVRDAFMQTVQYPLRDDACQTATHHATPRLCLTAATSETPLQANLTVVDRFCVAAALYGELACAGFFDLEAFPFIAVRRVRLDDLVGGHAHGSDTRVELHMTTHLFHDKCAAYALLHAASRHAARRSQPAATLPVAVARPVARKGVLRRPPTAGLQPSIATAPFTDGEVFQLFYLQLVLRTVCDMRFPHMTLPHDGGAALRSDRIGVCASRRGGEALAFAHPTQPQRWLLFPASSAAHVLTLLDLQHAVLPRLASAAEVQRTACLPLFGGESGQLPCQGPHGRRLVQWAGTQRVDSPRAAFAALVALFNELQSPYGCDRDTLWRTKTPLRLFHCDANAFAALFSRCFAPELLQPRISLPSSPDIAAAAPTSSSSSAETASARHSIDHMTSFARTYSALLPGPEASDVEAGNTTPVTTLSPPDGRLRIGPTSPFTRRESLVMRWRQYSLHGDISLFYGATDGVVVDQLIGVGGSGRVYRGCYGPQRLPVAIKLFVVPPGMSHAAYVRESLTDVAFYALLNQLSDFGICATCRAHDFIVSAVPPPGLSRAEATLACQGAELDRTRLCYFVTDLMDGALGRFLEPGEADYDPCYDTLVNSPLHDAELFQLLYVQLVSRAVFDWKVLDVMLNGQLRGDNLGFRYLAPPPHLSDRPDDTSATATFAAPAQAKSRKWYEGIIVQYRPTADATPRYLRFPSYLTEPSTAPGPLRCIYFIDLGQGMQPGVAQLTRRGLIGETVIESCITDDGLGRYWPLDELYCKYVEVQPTALSERVVAWGSEVRLRGADDARRALAELFTMYATHYSIEAPTEADLCTHLLLRWDCVLVEELMQASVYSDM